MLELASLASAFVCQGVQCCGPGCDVPCKWAPDSLTMSVRYKSFGRSIGDPGVPNTVDLHRYAPCPSPSDIFAIHLEMKCSVQHHRPYCHRSVLFHDSYLSGIACCHCTSCLTSCTSCLNSLLPMHQLSHHIALAPRATQQQGKSRFHTQKKLPINQFKSYSMSDFQTQNLISENHGRTLF